jgi:hypothetical protein
MKVCLARTIGMIISGLLMSNRFVQSLNERFNNLIFPNYSQMLFHVVNLHFKGCMNLSSLHSYKFLNMASS